MKIQKAIENVDVLYLVGMPGVGKSYWGERLAAQLGWQYVDMDEYITSKNGKTPAQIIVEQGEASYRMIEHMRLVELMKEITSGTVVACGGGAPCYHNNMALMLARGLVVYMQASVDQIAAQLATSAEERPLLSGGEVRERLNSLLISRAPIYEQAHVTIAMAGIDIDQLTTSIKECIEKQ